VKNAKTNWPLTVLLVISAPIWLPLIILFLLLLAILVPFSYSLLYLSIWFFWLTRGKDILFVYSDSPIWRDYMLSELLPLIESSRSSKLVRAQYVETLVAARFSIQVLRRA
jgi:hypothetical protein